METLKNYVSYPILCSMAEHNVKKKQIAYIKKFITEKEIGLDVSTLNVFELTEEQLFLEVWDIDMFGRGKCNYKPLQDKWINDMINAIKEADALS
jgi:hypothetical protein